MQGLQWKITSMLRSAKMFDTQGIVKQFKARILSFVECWTAAIYQANATVFDKIDKQYERFLRGIGLSKTEALMEYHLAPLKARRDMSMLGVIHRSLLGEGPEQIKKHIPFAFFCLYSIVEETHSLAP